MRDYSQHGEQAIILKALEDIKNGRFLDIGAFRPFALSNTRALYELGWSGVMVEPSPGPMRALLEEYGKEPRITLVQAAVAVDSNMLDLHVTDDAVSTSDAANFTKWEKAGGFMGTLKVPAIALGWLCTAYGPFDFVNIDAEGVSGDLFIDLLGTLASPRCICVEHDGKAAELKAMAAAHKYNSQEIGANLVVWRAP